MPPRLLRAAACLAALALVLPGAVFAADHTDHGRDWTVLSESSNYGYIKEFTPYQGVFTIRPDDAATEADIHAAEALYDEADYAGALDEFEAAGDYEDAASRITETTYQLGVQQLESGEVLDSYYTLYAIRDDADAYALLVSDSRYYIYVYDVGVGPNPLDE